MTYFVPIGVIKDRITKMYPNYFIEVGDDTTSYHLHDLAYQAWHFEKFVFGVGAPYSFEVT